MAAIDKDYVNQAEQVIKGLPKKRDDSFELTTTQLRVLLSLTAQLFDEAEAHVSPTLSASLQDKVQYLRVRFVYQAGREPAVKAFITRAKLLDALADIGDSRDNLLKFCRYMEALVAYKKFYDPKDK
jgi:CRISPR-associated protein Csm2